jgi:hypothetical protein
MAAEATRCDPVLELVIDLLTESVWTTPRQAGGRELHVAPG